MTSPFLHDFGVNSGNLKRIADLLKLIELKGRNYDSFP
jgi:hypothetical protein